MFLESGDGFIVNVRSRHRPPLSSHTNTCHAKKGEQIIGNAQVTPQKAGKVKENGQNVVGIDPAVSTIL